MKSTISRRASFQKLTVPLAVPHDRFSFSLTLVAVPLRFRTVPHYKTWHIVTSATVYLNTHAHLGTMLVACRSGRSHDPAPRCPIMDIGGHDTHIVTMHPGAEKCSTACNLE